MKILIIPHENHLYPICSMYGIFTKICLKMGTSIGISISFAYENPYDSPLITYINIGNTTNVPIYHKSMNPTVGMVS